MAAGWCDYDNDGLKDLAVVPGDLYRQVSPGQFQATGLLADYWKDLPGEPVSAWVTWFDMNNDGSRDLLVAVGCSGTCWEPPDRFPERVAWPVVLLENTLHENHWLEVNVGGPPGNRPGLGARVTVKADELVQTQEVGESDGSENGQGHYRLYYGLGAADVADSVEVRWQDGKTSLAADVKADQILTVKY